LVPSVSVGRCFGISMQAMQVPSSSVEIRVRRTFLERGSQDITTEFACTGLRRVVSDSILVETAAACVREAYAAELEDGLFDDDTSATASTAAPDEKTDQLLDEEDGFIFPDTCTLAETQ